MLCFIVFNSSSNNEYVSPFSLLFFCGIKLYYMKVAARCCSVQFYNRTNNNTIFSWMYTMAADQDAIEEQNAVLKVKEANASASKSMQFAVCKRQRAQLLMGNADLATYRATIALKIAEAALVADSPDAAAASTAHLLD